MDSEVPLEGACSCGRNHYFIYISSSPANRHLQIVVDDRVRDGQSKISEYHEGFTELTGLQATLYLSESLSLNCTVPPMPFILTRPITPSAVSSPHTTRRTLNATFAVFVAQLYRLGVKEHLRKHNGSLST